MLEISELVAAIQTAVSEASQQVHQKNLELLDVYFEPGDRDSDEHKREGRERPNDPPQSFSEAMCGSAARHDGGDDRDADKRDAARDRPPSGGGPLHAKMAVISYPVSDENGAGTHDVHVPLITLVPHNQLALKEVRLKLNVEPSDNGRSVRLAFPAKRSWFSPAPKNLGTIEIVIEGEPTPSGRIEMVEGYNRALRAQVPG